MSERLPALVKAIMKDQPRRGPAQCRCGRFAKWVSDRRYYDGNFDQYSYTVNCSRCGDVTVECV